MTPMRYLKTHMNKVSNVVYNASQGSVSKDEILDSLVRMLNDYNNAVEPLDRVDIKDWRK